MMLVMETGRGIAVVAHCIGGRMEHDSVMVKSGMLVGGHLENKMYTLITLLLIIITQSSILL